MVGAHESTQGKGRPDRSERQGVRHMTGVDNPELAVAAEAARRPAARAGRGPARISCIVCAYNEADRIQRILEAVYRHPALLEVIVVNDGSTDATESLLKGYPEIRVLSYSPNRGKTYALTQGISAARGEHLMLLDADLAGVTAADIQALIDPVASGRADVSISLRSNSLPLYRLIGLDFVSGERILPAWLLADAIASMERLPRWGGEAFINDLIIREGLSIAVVDWPRVFNVRKYTKVGLIRGLFAELAMVGDAVRVLSPWGAVRQNLQLLRLVRRGRRSLGHRRLVIRGAGAKP
jgi:glycosyltransferase involved in cell wall biosynthesis